MRPPLTRPPLPRGPRVPRVALATVLSLGVVAAFAGLAAGAGEAPGAGSSSGDAGAPLRVIDMSRAFDAGTRAPAAPIVITSTPADPTPMVERSQWVFDLRWDRGDLYLLDVQPLQLAAPRETPRAMGRFALELFEGPALIERVRFDFPLLGPPEADAGRGAPPSLDAKLRTRIGVVFPATARGTRLELWDRATNRRWSLPWPLPAGGIPAAGADAGPAG